MRFIQIELYNFGLYKGSHKIVFPRQKGNKNVILIGGLNGRGKTTILEAIFIALYGKRSMQVIRNQTNRSYAKMLNRRINKTAADKMSFVAVTFISDEQDGKKITVKRAWKDQKKNTSDRLEVMINGLADEILSQNWNHYVEEILPLNIARFFFFDNEQISEIAEEDSFEQIKESIKAVMGITAVDTLEEDIKKIIRVTSSKLDKSEDTNLQNAYAETKKKVIEAKSRHDILDAQKDNLTREIASLASEIETTEELFWKEGGMLGANKEAFEREREFLIYKQEDCLGKMRDLVNDARTPIYLCRDQIKSVANKWEQNEKNQAKNYAQSLLEKYRQDILQKIQEVFGGTEIEARLTEMISVEFEQYVEYDVGEIRGIAPQGSWTLLQQLSEEFFAKLLSDCKLLAEEHEAITEQLCRANVHLEEVINEGMLKEQYEEIRALEEARLTKKADLNQIEEEVTELNRRIKLLEKTERDLLCQLAEAEQKMTDVSVVTKYAAMTLQIMDEFKKRLQKNKVAKLQANITSCFLFLMGKANMVKEIKIDAETLDVHMMDAKQQEILKEQLSAGEKQMFAVSVLWGLAISSGYQMPVVIDTPMARLDSVHRTNFVTKYLPHASTQVVVLSTDEEIDGEYLTELCPYVNKSYTLQYDEKDETTQIEEGYFGKVICS